ncbi:MAG: TIGR00341 family protein [Cyanobacteria bacterium J06581_3]
MSSREKPISIKEQPGFKKESEKRTSPLAKKTLSDGQEERPIHRRSLLAVVRYYLPPVIHRSVVRWARKVGSVWSVNSGDWHWLDEKPLPLKLLNRSLWKGADPSLSYYVMLFLSGVIAVLGLLAGSTAAIIGAMIVAPLMGPIVAMAFAITMNNRRLLKQSGLSVLTGSLLTIFTAYLITRLLGITTLNPEILQRTQPTLIDLAVGLAAGAAGSFAKTRREIADALPGVAIAVALVPPLSVIGIGLALGSRPVTVGSTLLFLTNLCGIVLSSGLVFIWQDYGSVRRAKKGLTVSTIVVCLLGIPLGLSMRDLIIEEKTRSSISRLVRLETYTFRDTDVRRLKVEYHGDDLMVTLEVAAPEGSISAQQVNMVHKFLEKELERPISLNVSIFPVQEYSIPNSASDRRPLGRPVR